MRAQAEMLSAADARIDSPHRGGAARTRPSQAFVAVEERDAWQSPSVRGWPSRLQIVGILAFVQSLLFVAIWLWVCAVAGAAPPAKSDFDPDLRLSRYDPVKQRDPFVPSGRAKAGSASGPGQAVGALDFRLEGILYQAKNPSAVVNGVLLTLNKTVTLNTGNGEVQVKAVEITRDRVVLEASGQKVELRMNSRAPPRP